MDFTTNYCGPYWSSGKFQSSVATGVEPVSELDRACQMHDRAYALAKNQQDLVVADNKFYNDTKKLGFRGPLYGALVKYGNKAARDSMAYVLPFLGLAGASAASTVALSTRLPKTGFRGNIQATVVDPDGQNPTVCYSPDIPSGSPTPDFQKIDEVETAEESPFTSSGLYKPLGRKKLRAKIKNKNRIVPEIHVSSSPNTHKNNNKNKNIRNNSIHPSPDNKIKQILKHFKNYDQGKTKQSKTKHVDQENCTHPEIRACYNYKYCARCDREFHQGKRTFN